MVIQADLPPNPSSTAVAPRGTRHSDRLIRKAYRYWPGLTRTSAYHIPEADLVAETVFQSVKSPASSTVVASRASIVKRV